MSDNARIEDLRRRVRKDPASIAFAQLAEEYRRAGQYRESVDACCAGLVLHPTYLPAHVTLGRSLIELGELDQAQRELETVLRAAPENLAAIRGIGDIHYKRESFNEALAFYRSALELARNDPELEQTVGDLTRLGQATQPEAKDGLSLDQMEREMSARLPVPRAVEPVRRPGPGALPTLRMAASTARTDAMPDQEAAGTATAGREHDLLVLAALQQWLDAINVTRAQRAS